MDTLRNFLLVSLVVLLVVILYKRLLKKMGSKHASSKYTNFIEVRRVEGDVKIKIDVPRKEEVSLSVYDDADIEVDTVFSGSLDEGEHEFNWKQTRREGKNYYCQLKTKNQRATRYFS